MRLMVTSWVVESAEPTPGRDQPRPQRGVDPAVVLGGHERGTQPRGPLSPPWAPFQRPRIPIWVAGFWPNRPPFRRAARFDGALPLTLGHLMKELSAAELRRCRDYISAHRTSSDPFDLVAFAATQPRTPEMAAEYEQAGATWCVEGGRPDRRVTRRLPQPHHAAGRSVSVIDHWSRVSP
jgi:hypothetical protein